MRFVKSFLSQRSFGAKLLKEAILISCLLLLNLSPKAHGLAIIIAPSKTQL